MTRRRSVWIVAGVLALLLVAAGVGKMATGGGSKQSSRHHVPAFQVKGTEADSPTGLKGKDRSGARIGPAQERYMNQAFPARFIRNKQVWKAHRAYTRLPFAHVRSGRRDTATTWQELGPVNGNMSGFLAGGYIYPFSGNPATPSGQSTHVSGRITALAINPSCVSGNCVMYVAAAGGGIWKTTNALAGTPSWSPKSNGLPSMAIGSLAIDPHNSHIIYAGTGEANGSSDSEAGLGLYKSTDSGTSWHSVTGAYNYTQSRAIGAIAIDPNNSQHILIGTDVARHGASFVNGGRFTPPNPPSLGAYETTDGGSSWTQVLNLPQDPFDSTSANGSDFFSGGVRQLSFDPNDNSTVYAAVFAGPVATVSPGAPRSGLWRRIGGTGTATFAQIFHANNINDSSELSAFALANNSGKTRVYAGSGDSGNGTFWRVDNATDALAADLLASQTGTADGNPQHWQKLSNTSTATSAWDSNNFCQAQCSYDMYVMSPPGHPDTVVLGGSYDYLSSSNQLGSTRTNGHAVVRSTNAGTSFSDMTQDTESPSRGLHPDEHALVFDPNNPDIMFMASDGGLVRTNGTFTDVSSQCDSRENLYTGVPLTDPTLVNSYHRCQDMLSSVPTTLIDMNRGLRDLQYEGLAASYQRPSQDIMGGTQDNGTWVFRCGSTSGSCTTSMNIFGDGGTPAFDKGNGNIHTHEYTGAQFDVNFHGTAQTPTNESQWDWMSDAWYNGGESANFSFYSPFVSDPAIAGTMYTGGAHVWRTTDNGGSQVDLDAHCNEFTGDFSITCGDWVALGGTAGASDAGNLLCTFDATTAPNCPYTDNKGGSFMASIERAPSDSGTLWAGIRRGRIFVSKNANASDPTAVTYTQIDTSTQPRRFPSAIVVDPSNPNHAYISFSGYEAYTPGQPGHVFDVTYDPNAHSATWTDVSHDLGDQPVTGLEVNWATGDVYAATDWGVSELPASSSHWAQAASGLPHTAVYSLQKAGPWIYAGTHGRGVWRIRITP